MTQSNFSSRSGDLVDIRNVHVDSNQSTEERVKSFVEQIRDPYNFKVGNVVVHISYSDNEKSINDNFSNLLSSL
jgi:hypothetical protein